MSKDKKELHKRYPIVQQSYLIVDLFLPLIER